MKRGLGLAVQRSPYVVFSRLVTMQGLGLLAEIPLSLLRHPLPDDLKVELERLEGIASATIRRHRRLISHYLRRIQTQAKALTAGSANQAFFHELSQQLKVVLDGV